MPTYFVFGYLNLSAEEFTELYVGPLAKAIEEGASFVVGDAYGADFATQEFLKVNDCPRVTIYHLFNEPRLNMGFATIGGFVLESERDKAMTEASDADIYWLSTGRDNAPLVANIARRKARSVVTYFISGHLDLTAEEFADYYTGPLVRALEEGASFVVGDARGADSMAQDFLRAQGCDRVTVYHMLEKPRYNMAFATMGGYLSDPSRDAAMSHDSDADIAWVRPGREKSGTARNVARRKRYMPRNGK